MYLPGNKQKKQFKMKKKTRMNSQSRQNTIRFLLILFMDIFEDRLNGAQIFLGRKKRLYFPGAGSKQISQKRARVTTWATNLSGEENCLFLEDVSKHIHLK